MNLIANSRVPRFFRTWRAAPGLPITGRLRLGLLALLLVVWAVCLHRLTVFPPVNEDEPWIASTGWQIATHGVFGSPLFAGLWHMDTRYYDFMPLYSMVSALLFRAAGVGLFQARFVSVGLGILTLALVFRLGTHLVSARAGLAAALAFVVLPLTVPPYSMGSLFFDVARVARYDILVPVCGLSALLVYLYAVERGSPVRYAAAGLLAGLAGLAHMYGTFWFVVLVLLALVEKSTGSARRSRASLKVLLWLTPGFALPWIIYGAYVATGWNEFRAQTAWYENRFQIFDLHWYGSNILQEIARYQFPDFLSADLMLVVLGAGIAGLGYTLWQRPASNATRILLPLVVLTAGLAVFVESKTPAYLILPAPFFALTIGYLLETIARQWSLPRVRRIVWTGTAAVGLLLIGIQAWSLENTARHTTPYQNIVSALRVELAPHERVLGLHAYWFGLEEIEFHDWIVPLQWSTAQKGTARMSMTQALDRLAPDAVVIDARLRAYLENAGTDPRPAQIAAWLDSNAYRCTLQFQDTTYGKYEVYRRPGPATAGATAAPCPTQ